MLPKEKLTISTYTRGYLLQHEAITSKVAQRIFPSIAPEGTPTPFIVYERDTYEVLLSKMGPYIDIAEVVFEIVADDYDSGLDVAVAIHDILQGKHGGFTFELTDSAEFYKENKFRQSLLFKIK